MNCADFVARVRNGARKEQGLREVTIPKSVVEIMDLEISDLVKVHIEKAENDTAPTAAV